MEQAAGFVHTEAWLTSIADVETQVAVRHLMPAHHSTGALDLVLGRVRDFLASRTFVLCNKRRTILTLGIRSAGSIRRSPKGEMVLGC